MALINGNTFTFTGSIEDYDIVKTGATTWTVAGIDPALGVETLTDVPFLQFSDTGPLDIAQFVDTVGQTAATAATLSVGQSITSTIDSDGDLDFFAIDVDGSGRYLVTIEGVSSGGGTLENPVGEFGQILDFSAPEFGLFIGDILSNQDLNTLLNPVNRKEPEDLGVDFLGRGFGTNAAFELNRETFGTPDGSGGAGHISVGSLDGLGTGTYSITLEEISFDLGEQVTVDEPHTASLGHGLQTDTTVVNLEAGKHYVIEVDGAADTATPMGDAVIAFGARESDVPEFFRSDEARDPGESTQMVVTGNLDGAHFIKVNSATGRDPGDYTLTVTEIEDDFGTTKSTMGVLDDGETLSGSMDLLSDIDAFTVRDNGEVLSRDARYAARVDAAGNAGSPYGQFDIEEGRFTFFRADNGGGSQRTDDIFNGNGQAATDFVIFDPIPEKQFTVTPQAFAVRLKDDVDTELDYTVTFLEGTDTADETANFIELADTGAEQVLAGLGGSDILIGASTNDLIIGGAGNDIIEGEAGDDDLNGGTGGDKLSGGAGRDTIEGGEGNDLLFGGSDREEDIFVFNTLERLLDNGEVVDVSELGLNFSHDTIGDFETGVDKIDLRKLAGGEGLGFEDLQISDQGGDALITFDDGSITLKDVAIGELGAGDFLFAPPVIQPGAQDQPTDENEGNGASGGTGATPPPANPGPAAGAPPAPAQPAPSDQAPDQVDGPDQLPSSDQPASDTAAVEVFRFFNHESGAHFYTASPAERDAVSANLPNFQFEGNAFDSTATEATGGTAVFRFLNTENGAHFYTASAAEADSIRTNLPQFNGEGIAYFAHQDDSSGAIELFRFLNTDTGSHFYTTSEEERDNVITTLGHFNYEGVAFFVDPA